MSLPSAARRPEDDTAPTEPRPTSVACPHCGTSWPEHEAPSACPADGAAIRRPNGSGRAAELEALIETRDGGANDPMVGRTLEGRYTIRARLGAGSMGTVYRAEQHAIGREVAIKILRGDRAVDASAKARFMREARANSLLASPNTVTVFDFGQSETGEFYLAMELLDGESLGQRLARVGKLSPAVAVDTARQALRSLSEAHAKGIIHRDLKPDNLFFARVLTGSYSAPQQPHEEIVKVLDFGIAKMLNAHEQHAMGVVETQAGTVFGTPRYMSPEQAQGKPLDARSDLYSLGVILYQMLTGRPPFTDNDAVVVMARHIKSTPKRPNEATPEAQVPRELEDVVMRSLAKDPCDRPLNAEVMAGELLAALEAQGASASGVRASVTNVAGIRVPDSMRPPRVPLPRLRRKVPLVAIAAPVALVLASTAVYVGLYRARTATADEPASGDTRRSAAAATVAPGGAPIGATVPSAVGTAKESSKREPLTVTPDALPRASVAPAGSSMGSASSRSAASRTRTPPRPGASGSAPAADSASSVAGTSAMKGPPATAPASGTSGQTSPAAPAARESGAQSGQYGLFE